jgi:maleate isomerase
MEQAKAGKHTVEVKQVMIGWRGRIGLLVPATNSVMEADFGKYLPDGVAAFASRMYKSTEVAVEKLEEMLSYAEDAAKLLTKVGIDIIIFGCTSASFITGLEGDKAIQQKIARTTGVHTTTATTAILRALSATGRNQVALITPYHVSVHRKLEELLHEQGYTITTSATMDPDASKDVEGMVPEQIYRYVKANVDDNAELVLISCTTIRSMEAIEQLEKDLQIPVITVNQACIWDALTHLKIFDPVAGAGWLLQHGYDVK